MNWYSDSSTCVVPGEKQFPLPKSTDRFSRESLIPAVFEGGRKWLLDEWSVRFVSYVCVLVCVCLCVCVCYVYICMYVCMRLCVSVCVRVYVCVSVCAWKVSRDIPMRCLITFK